MSNSTYIPIELIRIREKNEITIPKSVRLVLGVEPGDWIQFEHDNNGGVVIHKIMPVRLKNEGDVIGKMGEKLDGGEDEVKKI